MNTTFFSLNQAAKQTGKSLSTIHKALKNGRLSYISKDDSGYKIDPAELFRVFPEKGENSEKKDSTERNRTPERIPRNPHEIDFEKAKIELAAAKREIEIYTGQIQELRTERDDWKKQAQTLLIATHPEKSPRTPPETRKGFFATLLSKSN